MGNPESKQSRTKRSPEDGSLRQKVGEEDFHMVTNIGEGNYAKVVLVRKKNTQEFYAMKILNKEALIERAEVEHTRTERTILEAVDHPFLVKMHYAFQTPDKLFVVMNFANGGELFSHLKREKRFSEDRARFYAAEIACGLEYLHEGGAVYRDLKPENVLLDNEGHIVLTDFGLSKILKQQGDKTRTFCGTPEYLAPEILLDKGHGKPVDWWSYGTLLFEMIVGIPPFYSTDVNQMYEMILFLDLFIPPTVSPAAADLLSKLLVRNPARRLGSSADGSREVKSHPFFQSVDWPKLLARQVTPPFIPEVQGPDDIRFIDAEFTKKQLPSMVRPIPTISKSQQEMFTGFTFEASHGTHSHKPNGAAAIPVGSVGTPSPSSLPHSHSYTSASPEGSLPEIGSPFMEGELTV